MKTFVEHLRESNPILNQNNGQNIILTTSLRRTCRHFSTRRIPAHFPRSAQDRENWMALVHYGGQFGQDQFKQFLELARSIYGRISPTGQLFQMGASLVFFLTNQILLFQNSERIFSDHTRAATLTLVHKTELITSFLTHF